MKEAFYFSHDYTARNDQKILTLRWDFWLEWYALYFMVLESMAEESDWYIHRVAIGGLWVSYGVAKEKLLSFIEKSIEIGLFIEDEYGIFSKRMLEHKLYRKTLSEQWKAGAYKRWKNSPTNSPPNAKERKWKEIEIKEKEIETEIVVTQPNEYQLSIQYLKENRDKVYTKEMQLPEYVKDEWEWHKFVWYWSELSKTWKLKAEWEKTFELKRRFATWMSRKKETYQKTEKPSVMDIVL